MQLWKCLAVWSIIGMLSGGIATGGEKTSNAKNLLENPSLEKTEKTPKLGTFFQGWLLFKYEGSSSFKIGSLAHDGKKSCLLIGEIMPKVRLLKARIKLGPGRYRMTAYLRGFEIGTGKWGRTTEFMFNEKYMQLNKNGTFGWTKLTYVTDLTQEEIDDKQQEGLIYGPSFGLFATGFLWVDDVTLEKVGTDVALTKVPVLGKEEAPIVPPGKLGDAFVRCPACSYKNMPEWKRCYGCNSLLQMAKAKFDGPTVRSIASFEEKKDRFGGKHSTFVEEHASDGKFALRLEHKGYARKNWGKQPQNWVSYDYFNIDFFNPSPEPAMIYIEICDSNTRNYYSRVNYYTVVPPGKSTLIMPIKQLLLGEKAKPNGVLDAGSVTRFVLSLLRESEYPLFIDNLRIERDTTTGKARFDGLHAFDFGSGPVLDGFTKLSPGNTYCVGRGYGLLAKGKRGIGSGRSELEPEPLSRDYIMINSGGLAVDLPNGKYKVVVFDNPPHGYWGGYYTFKERHISVEGKEVINEQCSEADRQKAYYQFWDDEDLPPDNTFDKYQKALYPAKAFTTEVTDGQLNLDFKAVGNNGRSTGYGVSGVIIYPLNKKEQGEKFLQFTEGRRRFYFDNSFKRVLHTPTGEPLVLTDKEKSRGYVIFSRDFMEDIYYNDNPRKNDRCKELVGSAFAGEYEPLTISISPQKDLGKMTAAVTDLVGPAGKITAAQIDVGNVFYGLKRVTAGGGVYTIKPVSVMPFAFTDMPKDITRRFWLTVKVPAESKPGLYSGKLSLTPEKGEKSEVPIKFTVHKGTLDPVDIPAGPWGHKIGYPWRQQSAQEEQHSKKLTMASLRKMREYGFTTFSGLPKLRFRGFKDGKPKIEYAIADEQMKMAREAGFTMPVVSYCFFVGLGMYKKDVRAMKRAGFKDYSKFVKVIFDDVQQHAKANNWLPVYWNIEDEPGNGEIKAATDNAKAYRKAYPKGPPHFTAATSMRGNDMNDYHIPFFKELHIVNLNLHDKKSVDLIHSFGNDWAFYNEVHRWTYGDYMYKAAKQYDMKFRIGWHWNVVTGNPYYALDCREDDYAWCNSSPDGTLIPWVKFERLREGLDDYRRMLTLARLAKEKAGTEEAKKAEELISNRLSAFKLDQRDHDKLFKEGSADWKIFRKKINHAINALR